MNSIQLRGEAGDVRHVYHRAAQLGAWTMDGGTLKAQVRSVDPFRLKQTPLVFEVRRPGGAVWSWPLRDVVVTGAEFSARVSDEEGSTA